MWRFVPNFRVQNPLLRDLPYRTNQSVLRLPGWLLIASVWALVGPLQAVAQADKTPPVLTELSVVLPTVDPILGPLVDVGAGPADILFRGRVTDDLSGVKLVSVFLVNPVNLTQELCNMERVSGDDKDGVYACTLTMSENSTDGAWILNLLLTDQSDNPGIVTGNALRLLKAPTTILVAHINLPPSPGADEYSTPEDTRLVVELANSVLANDTDNDGSVQAVLAKTTAKGELDLASDGTFTYTPEKDFFGSDSFVYQASDGSALSDSVTVTIEVSAVNDPPVLDDASLQVEEDVPAVLVLRGTDIEDDPLTYSVTLEPTMGTATMNGDRLTYKPNDGISGVDSLMVAAHDGTDPSEDAIIRISIGASNDGPSGQPDAYSTAEDVVLTISSALGVLSNDTDPDGDVLESTLTGSTRHGRLILQSDGSFTYEPDPDFFGTDGFAYTTSDGQARTGELAVTITVTPVNDVPVADPVTLDLAQGSTTTLTATDADGDALEYGVATAPAFGSVTVSGSTATYQPGNAFPGTDTFAFVAFDGQALSSPAVVSVVGSGVVLGPSAQADAYSVREDESLSVPAELGVLSNDSGTGLVARVDQQPAQGTLSLHIDGSFDYLPNPDFFGTDGFSYSITDGSGLSAVSSVHIRVDPVNDAPSIPVITVPAPGSTLIISGDPMRQFQIGWRPSVDVEGDPVTYTWHLVDDIGATMLREVVTQTDSGSLARSAGLQVTQGPLAAALTASGIATGSLATLVHWVEASDGQATSVSEALELRVFRGAVTGNQSQEELPQQLTLRPNYPNPFNPRTVLSFGLPQAGSVRLTIMDLLGRVLAVGLDQEMPAGWHEVPYDASGMASGTYLQILEAGSTRLARPLIISK